MRFEIANITIRDLIRLIESEKLDLKPPYQRNDIWSKRDQQDLIESVLKGYPIPNFFIYQKENGRMEMVDGQQRSRTLYRYYSNQIQDKQEELFKDKEDNERRFLDYNLSVTYLYDIESTTELEEFYVLVNKKGKHLTTPELHKAEFGNTRFMQLVERLLEFQPLMSLNLFTESSSKRMNDRNFIEELVAYLIHGIQDKKKVIETIYNHDISEDESEELEATFKSILEKIELLNNLTPIVRTRYKQRSDFYTLFNFIHHNLDESESVLIAQYGSLLILANYISPSLVTCPPLREYAIHCVSQSNSRKAREERLNFFNSVLKNTEEDLNRNHTMGQIFDFIRNIEVFDVDLKRVNGYFLIQTV